MNLRRLLVLFYLANLSLAIYAVNLPEYLSGRYTIRFVNQLPEKTDHQLLIFSSRFFLPEHQYALKRGVHPRYQNFLFVVGTQGDSAFIQPLERLDQFRRERTPYPDFLVYVDGHGKTFNQVVERGIDLTGRFAINLVIFDWPTDYLALRKTAYNASEVAASFITAMRQFSVWHKSQFPSASVSVFFHSMGNQILRHTAHRKLLPYMPEDLFSNIILNAAAVRQDNHARWLEKLNTQKRIYVTINRNDRTLQGARLLRVAEQLGLGHNGRTAENATYVDFSQVASTEHNLFLGKSKAEKANPLIYEFYNQVLHGMEVNFQNETAYQILSPSEVSFRFSLR
jgi:hypothetical protein